MSDRFDHLFIAPKDFDASLAFYRDVMGWTVLSSWGEAGHERGALLSSGALKVVLAERRREPRARHHDAAGARIRIHLDIHDVDERFRKLPKGEHVVASPEATPDGRRWFLVSDPDGNLIAFEELHERG